MFKGRTPLVIAAILSALALILVYKTIDYKEKSIMEEWALDVVVVADRAVPVGTELTYDMVSQRQMPKQFVSPSVVKPEKVEKIIGQKLLADLQEGDPILWSHFKSPGTVSRMSSVVRKQGRAVSLNIDGAAGVAGWVRPNDHVDVLGTFQDPKSNEMVTLTLLRNVIVLATGKHTGNSDSVVLGDTAREYNSITVMLLPEEAEIAVLASSLGSLQLALRNPEDIGADESRPPADLKALMTGERTEKLAKRRVQTFTVEYLTGGSRGN